MLTKTKTIKMLLYDGSLNGVTNISDSAWESGKMFSAPRESIESLVSKADCRKYGVYLLLSDQQVYVGQAIDLERRTKQHLSDKDWWTQVILMTTKDDSFNSSDIDYLEARLIDLATKAGTSDRDNKKMGNRKKVDEFRQAELEQYLDEALFLLELIGIRVFKKENRKLQKKSGQSIDLCKEPDIPEPHPVLPELPDGSMKIGEFVYATMKNLENAGYVFSDTQINEMCTEEWSKNTFHTTKPFMKRFVSGITSAKDKNGYMRFKAEPYTYGEAKVLISKEWYERQRKYFIKWYNSLK